LFLKPDAESLKPGFRGPPDTLPYVPAVQLIRWRERVFSFSQGAAWAVYTIGVPSAGSGLGEPDVAPVRWRPPVRTLLSLLRSWLFPTATRGSRPGLHSCAASRLRFLSQCI